MGRGGAWSGLGVIWAQAVRRRSWGDRIVRRKAVVVLIIVYETLNLYVCQCESGFLQWGSPLENGAVFVVEGPVGVGARAEGDFLVGVAVADGFEIGFDGVGFGDVAVVVAVAGAGFDDDGEAVGLGEGGEE